MTNEDVSLVEIVSTEVTPAIVWLVISASGGGTIKQGLSIVKGITDVPDESNFAMVLAHAMVISPVAGTLLADVAVQGGHNYLPVQLRLLS